MWNADIYGLFEKNRIQPSIDLVNRIELKNCASILDIGCGSGMSTAVLKNKYPDASVIGVDLSSEMLEKARTRIPDVTWLQRDCSQPLTDLGHFDLVFSNAFLQWLPNQEEFLIHTQKLLAENGIFAIQIPAFDNMPAKIAIDLAAKKYSNTLFTDIERENCHNFELSRYYSILEEHCSEIEVWQTNYQHIMDSYASIITFLSGSALNPYFSRLNDMQKEEFLIILTEEIKRVYRPLKSGKILFEFKRIFLLSRK